MARGQSALFTLVEQAMEVQARQLELAALNDLYSEKLRQGHRLDMAEYCRDLTEEFAALCRDMAALSGALEQVAMLDYHQRKAGTA